MKKVPQSFSISTGYKEIMQVMLKILEDSCIIELE